MWESLFGTHSDSMCLSITGVRSLIGNPCDVGVREATQREIEHNITFRAEVKILGVDSPLFSTIVLFKNRLFP